MRSQYGERVDLLLAQLVIESVDSHGPACSSERETSNEHLQNYM